MKRTVEIPTTELATLRRKAIAHDDYLAAIRVVEARYARLQRFIGSETSEFTQGYSGAVEDLAQAIADVVSDRFAEADMVGQAGSSELFD